MVKLFNTSLSKKGNEPANNSSSNRKKKEMYFDVSVPTRLSRDMVGMIDHWIKNSKDDRGNPLFSSRSHFIKCSIIYHFRHLKEINPDKSEVSI